MLEQEQIDQEPRFPLADIFRTMREGILILSRDKVISQSNKAASMAFGKSDGIVDGKRLSEVIRDFSLHTTFENAIQEKVSGEVRIELLGDDIRIFDVLVTPLDLSDAYAAMGIFYEVTRVERLERVRQEFLSNISHELRTPLTSILAFVETLSDGAIDDADNNRKFLNVIKKNAERMNLLINDISELSLIEAGKISVKPVSLDAGKMVDEIVTSLSARANEQDIKIVNEIPADTFVVADAVRIQQMLTNLIENAIKFNRRRGEIIISSDSKGERDILRVTDSGEGISREHIKRIFERFYRVDRARSREIGGTGLGLAIVKHLAKLHGGEVTVTSTAGKGTTFSLILPKR